MPDQSESLRLALMVGQRMRAAQTQYFKTRDRTALTVSKSLEKEFDQMCTNMLYGGALPLEQPDKKTGCGMDGRNSPTADR